MALLSYRTRTLLVRGLNVVRPKPQLRPLSPEEVLGWSASADLVEQFNRFYAAGMGQALSWRGVPVLKNPCDMWMMSELIQRLRPTAIVETGTHHGGSAAYYADIASMNGVNTTVVTVDLNPKWQFDPRDHGIESIVGYSTDEAVVEKVHGLVAEAQRRRQGHVLVVLDSDHSEENVRNELALYSTLVTESSYVVVEDTNTEGARAAADAFVAHSGDFERDISCERFLLTFHPGGWLKRVRNGSEAPDGP
jgi:cephalosporin hydroxylase